MDSRDVMQTHIVSSRHSSSTEVYISRAFVPCGSRIDSVLSRTMRISFDDRNGSKGVRLSGFSIPAPVTFESWLRKCGRVAGN